MHKRLPASLINRLEKLELSRRNKKLRPVAMFPRPISVYDWEELAIPAQLLLKDNIRENTAPDYGSLPEPQLVATH
jgi:hypothetical protein